MRPNACTVFALLLPLFLAAAPVLADETPNAPVELGEAGDTLVSMNFDGAALKDVLKILSQQSGMSFVASSEVESKKVTVFLEGVPVRDALESLIDANDLKLEKKKGGNVFVVRPKEEALPSTGGVQTRVFKLKYMRLSISPLDVGGKSVVNDLLKPQEISALGAGGGAAGSDDKGGDDKEDKSKNLPLVSTRGVDKLVASLLSENGKATVDLHTNSLIVTDTPASLARVEKVLEKIDVPTKQVMIEVHLIEVNKTVLDDHGVDWGGANGALFAFSGASRETRFPFQSSLVPSANLPVPEFTLGTVSAANFGAVLRFITTQTDTKILARPRVLTLNNEAANIRLATSVAVARTSTLIASQSITTLQTGQAERSDVGISLRMTPQINDDETVSLFVEPSVTTVAASTFFPADFLDPTTREVRTTARVRNHDTLVIGGLIDRNDAISDKRVPFLHALPIVGNAFSYKAHDNTDRELLIFITPHIVKGYDSLAVPSATAPYRDLAVKRMLDVFADEEVARSSVPVESSETAHHPIYGEEKKLVEESARRVRSNPAIEKEMGLALDSVSRKNPS